MSVSRPDPSEHHPYYSRYIDLVPERNVVDVLKEQFSRSTAQLQTLTPAQALQRYAPGKWSVLEVIGHLSDVERVFAYCALRVARCEPQPTEGFDENLWVQHAHFDTRSLEDLLAEWQSVRTATLSLLTQLSPKSWTRTGSVSKSLISVRALAYLIAGHELHHLTLLRERYGVVR